MKNINNNKSKKKLTIGLCLSGGGARGIAHVGVLKAMEEYGISIDIFSGVSMGAIVAGLAASGRNSSEILDIVGETSLYKLLTIGIPLRGLTDLTYLRNQLQKIGTEDSFESLPKKLFIGVTNLNSGKSEIFDQGPLHTVVEASASVPLIFKPVTIGGNTYVDGGLSNNLPVEPLIDNCDFIIGVNCNPNVAVDTQNWNIKTVAERSLDIIMYQNAEKNQDLCDFFFQIDETFNHNFLDFGDAEEIFQLGYEEGCNQIPKLVELLEKRRDEIE